MDEDREPSAVTGRFCSREGSVPLSPTSCPLETCVDPLDGDLRPPLDPLRVNARSTQCQEIAANAGLTRVTETGD
jgi:hypothetical protein